MPGRILLFLNNDVKIITPGWIKEMLGVCQRPEVGAVGVKLIYPDNTIQHAGCVIGNRGIAGHMFVDTCLQTEQAYLSQSIYSSGYERRDSGMHDDEKNSLRGSRRFY